MKETERIATTDPPRMAPSATRLHTVSAQAMQRTLAGAATVEGVGLFTGQRAVATLKPGPVGQGIVFVRTDLPGAPSIPATVEHLVDRPRRTTIRKGDAIVETVEHLLSALAGMQVDNAVVEIEGVEVPAVDGSAAPFVEAIARVGTVEQELPRRPIVVREPLALREGDATIVALPSGGGTADFIYDLDYGPEAPLPRQAHAFLLDPERFATQIAPARTYALHEEARLMQQRGMCAHLTTRDMLVIGENGPIDNSFRFDDEPVRHKVLDLIGDLALTGRPIVAKIVACRSGHALNHRLARALVELGEGAPPVAPPPPALNIRQVLGLLPHRYPMVLVDRVLEIDGDRRAVGIKNVTFNEPFFQGHYPGSPIMPGVLIVEAMSQLAGLMLSQKLERTGKMAILLSLDGVRLRKPVTPGDTLHMETEVIRATNRFGEVRCQARVEGALVAEATVKFMMVDAENDS